MNNERCPHCIHSLVVEPKSVQMYGAAALMLCCCIFTAGYFFGKKTATQNFKEEIEQQAFADQIQHSLHMLYNANGTMQPCEEVQEPETVAATTPEVSQIVEKEKQPTYYARLITYQSPVLAQKFVEKLKKRGIKTSLVKKVNRAQNGKTIRRYQVVTAPYESQEELMKIVNMLKKTEKLAHVSPIEQCEEQKGNS